MLRSPIVDQAAIVEPAEAVLEPVVHRPEQERRRIRPRRQRIRANRKVVVSASSVPSTSTNATAGGGSRVGQGLAHRPESPGSLTLGRSGRPGSRAGAASGASADHPDDRLVLLDRTWAQRSAQSSRSPSRRSAFASG